MDPRQGSATRKWKSNLFDAALVTITVGAFGTLLYFFFRA